jgi:hypothetical protein
MAVDWDEIAERVAAVHRRVMDESVADTQKRLSIPYPPSSRPGDYPHRRNGFLMRNIAQMTTRSGLVIRSKWQSNAWFSDRLEHGGPSTRGGPPLRPRPFVTPSTQRATTNLITELRAEFSG